MSSCAVSVAGEPRVDAEVGSVEQTSPKPLPFTPKVKDRTNDRNDGSSFEPCAEYTASELRSVGVEPASIEDAAAIDGANYRGCHWDGIDYTLRSGGTLYSQIVGLKMSLAEYKRHMSMMRWQADRLVQGRTLALAGERYGCTAVFVSQEAIVATIVDSSSPSPGVTVECEKAVAFASLAITKAPR